MILKRKAKQPSAYSFQGKAIWLKLFTGELHSPTIKTAFSMFGSDGRTQLKFRSK